MALTLTNALLTGRLEDFIAQEENVGRKAALRKFERLIQVAIKQPLSVGQTTRSPSASGAGGK